MTDREALKEFLVGATFSVVILAFFVSYVVLVSRGSSDNKSEEKFKVVDKYGPCEVVRYAPKNGANYAYFLDCK